MIIPSYEFLYFALFLLLGLDKASPSSFCLSQQPGLHIQPQSVCIYGVSCATVPCTAAFLPHPLGTAQDQQQLPMQRVLANRGDFCRSPKPVGNANPLPFPLSLKLLLILQRRERCWGNVGVGGGNLGSAKPENIKARRQRFGGDRGGHLPGGEPRSPGGFAGSLSSPASGGSGPSHAVLTFLQIPSGAGTRCFISRRPERRRALQECGQGAERSPESHGGSCT